MSYDIVHWRQAKRLKRSDSQKKCEKTHKLAALQLTQRDYIEKHVAPEHLICCEHKMASYTEILYSHIQFVLIP